LKSTAILQDNPPESNNRYCPKCKIDRIILRDMLHSKGHSRLTDKARKANARIIVDSCALCRAAMERK
jgi:hypothetical protein